MTELCEFFLKHKSDKCPQINHNYSGSYYELLKDKKESFKDILEIGIGNLNLMVPICGKEYIPGASLRAWRDFFPNANVFGLDIDKSVLFFEERISCFYTDQSDEIALVKTVEEIRISKNVNKISFDLIIDDGSHVPSHMKKSLDVLSKYLSPGGFYIIEDLMHSDMSFFENYEVNDLKFYKVHKTAHYGFVVYTKEN